MVHSKAEQHHSCSPALAVISAPDLCESQEFYMSSITPNDGGSPELSRLPTYQYEQWARVAGVFGWGQSLPSLASSSARSFPGIPTCDGIHWATTFIPIPRSFSIASIESLMSRSEPAEALGSHRR